MHRLSLFIAAAALTFTLPSCTANYSQATLKAPVEAFSSPLSSTRDIPRHSSGEPMPFFEQDDAKADLEATLLKAAETGKKPLVIMGANWCHDSRALAAHFETSKFVSLINAHYEPVYIDVGEKDRNIDIAQRFGYDTIEGTPTVIILGENGEVLNSVSAPTWRNAASRTEHEVYDYFHGFARGTLVE